VSKQLIGKVVSTKMAKTIVVEVRTERPHPVYKKVVRRSKRFKVHNENAEIKVGSTVRIGETRPLSAHKRFRVLEVIG
jgi:small subunit ribosomal protein S17